MDITRASFLRIYQLLHGRFGCQGWWPAETPFEVVIGAILTQSTSWGNVEKAIANLKAKNLLSPDGIGAVSEKRLSTLIRPALYYNVKAKKLKAFVGFLRENYDGDLNALSKSENLRETLLSVWGVGPETADSIMLYALGVPSFVVDAYTKRVFSRLGMSAKDAGYDELKEMFDKNLPRDVKLYKEYHALIVELGKRYCKKRPLCGACPLAGVCENIT